MTQTQVFAHPEHKTTLTHCECGDFKHRAIPSHSTPDKRQCKHIAKICREVRYFQTTLDDGYGRPYCGCHAFIQEQQDSCIHLELLGQGKKQSSRPTMAAVAQMAKDPRVSEEDLWAAFELV